MSYNLNTDAAVIDTLSVASIGCSNAEVKTCKTTFGRSHEDTDRLELAITNNPNNWVTLGFYCCLVLMLMFAIFICYADRTVMPSCIKIIGLDFNFSKSEQGLILSFFLCRIYLDSNYWGLPFRYNKIRRQRCSTTWSIFLEFVNDSYLSWSMVELCWFSNG